jgi:hypothetical protein
MTATAAVDPSMPQLADAETNTLTRNTPKDTTP